MSVCLSVCYYIRYQQKALDLMNKKNARVLLEMFSSRVIAVFSSPQKLYLVLMPQNRHQRVTIVLLLDYWYVKRGA